MAGRVICATSARRFLGVIMAPAPNPGSVCVTQIGVACSVTKVRCKLGKKCVDDTSCNICTYLKRGKASFCTRLTLEEMMHHATFT